VFGVFRGQEPLGSHRTLRFPRTVFMRPPFVDPSRKFSHLFIRKSFIYRLRFSRYTTAGSLITRANMLRFQPWTVLSHPMPQNPCMKTSHLLEDIRRNDGEHIASFGQARLVRLSNGHYELRQGTSEDHRVSREWIYLFLHEAVAAV
jgi:hypothetical protein